MSAFLCSVSHLCMLLPPLPLPQYIKGMEEVVPACLTAACPALRTLRFYWCTLAASEDVQQPLSQQTVAVVPTQLQTFRWHTGNGIAGISSQALASTLAALPCLTSLEVTEIGTGSSDDMSTVLSALTAQLTRLVLWPTWRKDPICCVASFLTAPAIWTKLTQLQELDVKGVTVNDAGLRVLLAHMKGLARVRVHTFELQDSHAEAECSWEELSMETVSVTSLAHLPLPGIECVWVDEVVSTAAVTAGGVGDAAATASASASSHTPAPTAPAAKLAAALAAAPDCTFECEYFTLKCHVDEMPVLLPLLARWTGIGLLQLKTPHGECMTPDAMGALRALLEATLSCTDLSISGPTPHPSALLLPALARTSVRMVNLNHDRMTEAELMLWCEGGQRSHHVTVYLGDYCKFVGNIFRVLGAVRVAGSGVDLEGWSERSGDDDDEFDLGDVYDYDEDMP